MSVPLVKSSVPVTDPGVEKSTKLLAKGALLTLSFPKRKTWNRQPGKKLLENHLLLGYRTSNS